MLCISCHFIPLEPLTLRIDHAKYLDVPLALQSQTSIKKLEAPSAYQRSSKCMKTAKKNQFYKDSVRFYKYKSLFILIETNTIFIKLIFFDVVMHFELR